MSTLQFPYPRTWKTTVNYTLKRVDDDTAEDHFTLEELSLIRESQNSETYLARLMRDGELVAGVVCKLAYGKRNLKLLRHEVSMYKNELKELQGMILPGFLGYYEAEMEDEELTGCLVTDYCGDHPKVPLHGLPWDMKKEVIKTLMILHDAGVAHGDFADRNVVISEEGFPCLLDFGHATPHQCGRKMKITFHAPRPSKEEFGCDELYEACKSLAVWTLPEIKYLYRYCPLEYAADPEKLARECAPKDMPYELALDEAYVAVGDFARMWNDRLECKWW